MVLLNIPDKSYKHNSIDFNGGDIYAYREDRGWDSGD